MDELIFAIILAILAALILGQLLKGILRLIAMALVGLTLVGLSLSFNSPHGGRFLTNVLNPEETIRVETEGVETNPVETASAETDSRVSRPFGLGQNDTSTVDSSSGPFSGADTRAGAIPDTSLSDASPGNSIDSQPSSSGSSEGASGTGRPLPPASTPPPSKSRPINGLW